MQSKILIYVLISIGLFILVYYIIKLLGRFSAANKIKKKKNIGDKLDSPDDIYPLW